MQEMWETQLQALGREDPLEKGMATHSSILSWRIPWTEEPGGLQFRGSQRVGHDWSDLAYTQCIYVNPNILIYPTPFPLAFHTFILYVLLTILNYDLLLVFRASVFTISNMGVEVEENMSDLCKACNSEQYLMYSQAYVGSHGLILTFTNCLTGKAL